MARHWRCFHCDAVFTDRRCASAHFGRADGEQPACQIAAEEGGLIEALRRRDAELLSYRVEDTDLHRLLHSESARRHREVKQAEEAGYNKALRDVEAGRLEPAFAASILPAIHACAEGTA